MAATQLEPISPELVLVSPELRAALAAEFRARSGDGMPSTGRSHHGSPVVTNQRRDELRRGSVHRRGVAATGGVAPDPVAVTVAAGAYAAQRLVGVTLQGAALVAALIVTTFALTHV